uniref:Uncharacterized protein n=1 Tax=Arundo donax TaxID=35708 RepID=A0A0A8XS91_ARUDO
MVKQPPTSSGMGSDPSLAAGRRGEVAPLPARQCPLFGGVAWWRGGPLPAQAVPPLRRWGHGGRVAPSPYGQQPLSSPAWRAPSLR